MENINNNSFKTIFKLTDDEKFEYLKRYYNLEKFTFGIQLIYGCYYDEKEMNDSTVLLLASGSELNLNEPKMIEQTVGELDMSENSVATLIIRNGSMDLSTNLKIENNHMMGNVEKIGIELLDDLSVRLVFQSGNMSIYSEKYAIE